MIKFLCITIFFIYAVNSYPTGENCKWRYKCCKLVEGRCVKMCEPEIICDLNEEEELGSAFHVFNVQCKFGFKSDKKGNCRKVM